MQLDSCRQRSSVWRPIPKHVADPRRLLRNGGDQTDKRGNGSENKGDIATAGKQLRSCGIGADRFSTTLIGPAAKASEVLRYLNYLLTLTTFNSY